MSATTLAVLAAVAVVAVVTAPANAGLFVRVAQLLDCPTCLGSGEVEQRDLIMGGWIPVTCQACNGTGEAGAA